MPLPRVHDRRRAEYILLGYQTQIGDTAHALRAEWHIGMPTLFGMDFEELEKAFIEFFSNPLGYFHDLVFEKLLKLLDLGSLPDLDANGAETPAAHHTKQRATGEAAAEYALLVSQVSLEQLAQAFPEEAWERKSHQNRQKKDLRGGL